VPVERRLLVGSGAGEQRLELGAVRTAARQNPDAVVLHLVAPVPQQDVGGHGDDPVAAGRLEVHADPASRLGGGAPVEADLGELHHIGV